MKVATIVVKLEDLENFVKKARESNTENWVRIQAIEQKTGAIIVTFTAPEKTAVSKFEMARIGECQFTEYKW